MDTILQKYPNAQQFLVSEMYSPEEQKELQRVMETQKSEIIIHSQQLYYLMGLILRYGDSETIEGEIGPILLNQISRLLLMTNDLISQNAVVLSGNGQIDRERLTGNFWQIGQFSQNLETNLATELSRTFKHFDQEYYNFEFLKESPLLEFTPNRYLCLSFPYLIMKATRGIYEIIRSQLNEQEKNEFSSAVGDSYEFYVKELIYQTYANPLAQRFFAKKSKRTEVSDGVLDYGDNLFFFEIKAKTMKKKNKLGNSIRDIEGGLNDFIIRKGAKQLHKRITEFKAGQISLSEISPQRIKKYWPVLITCIEEIPQFEIITDHYTQLLKKYDLLQAPDIQPLTIINLQEIEFILSLVEQGHSLVKLFQQKQTSYYSKESFKNFLIVEYDQHFIRPRSLDKSLEDIFIIVRENLGLEDNSD